MSKTAVSILQELMMKQHKSLPDYVVITNHPTEKDVASFTCKVTCDLLSALGTALSKKEAKQCAAMEMLKLLQPNCSSSLPVQSSPLKTNSISIDSCHMPGSENVLPDPTFINFVGKLNEHCSIQKLHLPQYEVIATSGLSHMMVFTITCSIGPLRVEGTGKTKKQAKQEAAQNMLQILMKDSLLRSSIHTNDCVDNASLNSIEDFFQNIKIIDLQITEPLLPISETAKKAMDMYPSLCHTNAVKISKDVMVRDYHYVFKVTVNGSIRDSILKHLRRLAEMTKSDVLESITNLMNANFETKMINSTHGQYMIQCKLDTTPVIIDIGTGTTLLDAKDKAITNFLSSVNLLLI